MLHAYTHYGQPTKLIVGVLFAIFWFLMIQVVTWLYVFRIESLGKYMKYDKWIRYTPYILGGTQVLTMVGIIMHAADYDNTLYIYTSVTFSFVSIVIELFMTVLLLKKLQFILEYRKELLKKLVSHIYMTCTIIIVVEILILVLKLTMSSLDYALRPFEYLIRTYVIIQFYDELITGVQTGSNKGLSSRDLSYCLEQVIQSMPEDELEKNEA